MATNRYFSFSSFAVLALSLGFSSTTATCLAQAIDAGALSRNAESVARPPEEAPPAAAPVAPRAKTGPVVQVRRFVVEGATLMPAARLEALLAKRAGALHFSDLELAAQVVSREYARRGFFARATVPPQDVTDGVVRIEVIEGVMGRTTVLPGAPANVDADYVRKIATARLKEGAPYSAADLERGLLLADDLAGVSIRGVLKSGEGRGRSDLDLTITDEPFFSGVVSVNNQGSIATGVGQAFATASLANFSGHGDRLQLSGQSSARLVYGKAVYRAPIGADGLSADLGLSTLRYRLGHDFAALESEGQAGVVEAGLAYPLVRASRGDLSVRLSASRQRYADDVLDTPLRRKRLVGGALEVWGERTDRLAGGGHTSFQLRLAGGRLDLSDQPDDAEQDALTARAAGDYGKLVFEINRAQRLARSLYLRGRLFGQTATGNLDTAEQASLGGPTNVRAYPVIEGAGDEAAVANLELHRPVGGPWASRIDLYGFVDGGWVRQHRKPWDGWNASGQSNAYTLAGAGLGATWNAPGGLNLSLVAAAPLGPNPGQTAPGVNQDGSRRAARAWLSLSRTF